MPPKSNVSKTFFAILKQHFYDGNWSAKNREGLIRRIQEIDMNMIIKMVDNLLQKL